MTWKIIILLITSLILVILLVVIIFIVRRKMESVNNVVDLVELINDGAKKVQRDINQFKPEDIIPEVSKVITNIQVQLPKLPDIVSEIKVLEVKNNPFGFF